MKTDEDAYNGPIKGLLAQVVRAQQEAHYKSKQLNLSIELFEAAMEEETRLRAIICELELQLIAANEPTLEGRVDGLFRSSTGNK